MKRLLIIAATAASALALGACADTYYGGDYGRGYYSDTYYGRTHYGSTVYRPGYYDYYGRYHPPIYRRW